MSKRVTSSAESDPVGASECQGGMVFPGSEMMCVQVTRSAALLAGVVVSFQNGAHPAFVAPPTSLLDRSGGFVLAATQVATRAVAILHPQVPTDRVKRALTAVACKGGTGSVALARKFLSTGWRACLAGEVGYSLKARAADSAASSVARRAVVTPGIVDAKGGAAPLAIPNQGVSGCIHGVMIPYLGSIQRWADLTGQQPERIT